MRPPFWVGIIAGVMGIFDFAQARSVSLGACSPVQVHARGVGLDRMAVAPFLVSVLGFVFERLLVRGLE